eukprot:PITA_05844
MGSSSKWKAIKDLLNQEHPDLLLIQETKITEQDFQQQLQHFKNFTGLSISSDGASGGIGTIWNKNNWEIIHSYLYPWWIRTDMKNKGTQEVFHIYNIYSPNHYRDKISCWNTIEADLLTIHNSRIIIGGNMNVIRNAQEKFGGNFHADTSRDKLESIIQSYNLLDTPLSNGKYTWNNKRSGSHNIKERLDRFLIQEGIAKNHQSIKSYLIHASASDHKPVILNLVKERNLGPLPFKYNKIWDLQEDFRALIQNQWDKEVIGSPHFVWETKLKHLRVVIKQWEKEVANAERKKKTDLIAKMEWWHNDKESTHYSEEDLEQEKNLYKELFRQNRLEEEEQRLKSRCLWLKAGDKNTSFFHNNIKLRRAGNQIDKIEVDGKEVKDQEEIKDAAHNHFKALLTAAPQQTDSADFLSKIECKLSEEHNQELDQDITEEEIRAATFSMQQDKAPGPDGFTVAFYRQHWETIKKDFIRMIKNVFRNHKLGENTKSSHIALIPKEANPLSFDRFHPISLCNVSYKIITKILANRLKKVLPLLISENQGGFVPSRQITENVILIQEAIHSSNNRGEQRMIIKLDMANAFDRVDQSFLTAALKKFGISSNFISIINGCISNPWTAPLINGRANKYFRSSRGLRQGCLLSPFLYIIMAETLSTHLDQLRNNKEIPGICIEKGIKEINHSLFTDDTLLIGGASSLMARRFKRILDAFLSASGGKLNNRKCRIYTWNVPPQIQQRISLILDIPVQRNWGSFPYLGLPLAKESVKSEVWTKHIEKMRGLLQGWGASWLNLAGRTILIKAVLSALPIYQYTVIMAPTNAHKHLELIMRIFLWQGGKQETKKFSLVKWDQVTLPYEKGGLSIKLPNLSNQALGLKLIWKILSNKGSWWAEAIKRKYLRGPNSNILTEAILDRPCTPMWRLIKKVLPHFKENVSKLPGNGKDTKIWLDRIMGSKPRNLLQDLRPLQDWIEARKITSLFDISLWNHNRWLDWKDIQTPPLLKDQWINLKLSLSGSAPKNMRTEDRYIWDPCGGNLTVKEGYKSLQNLSPAAKWNLHAVAWKTECIPKVKYFNWTLLKGKTLTAKNLRKKGIQGPSICCFCRAEEESIQHIFLACPLAHHCWKQLICPMESRESFDQIPNLQKNWMNSYPYTRKGKHNLIRPNTASILAKTIASISESISANYIAFPDQTNWLQDERDWYSKFSLIHNQTQLSLAPINKARPNWKLRGSKEEVQQWISNQKRPVLLFDGASKNNPGKAGAGGIIKDQNGKSILSYEWGLGNAFNNAAEAYSLFLGTSLLSRLGIRNAIILGDSAIIIGAMVSGRNFKKEGLNNIKTRIHDNLR